MVFVICYCVIRLMFDWVDGNFGEGFGVFVFLIVGFQLNYMFLYFIIYNLVKDELEVVCYVVFLWGIELVWQVVSYGFILFVVFVEVGGVYINFGLWVIVIFLVWLVVCEFGIFKVEFVEEWVLLVEILSLKSDDKGL